MAEKDHKRINLYFISLKVIISKVEWRIYELMKCVNSSKSDEKVMALKVKIGLLWLNQEDVKMRLFDLESQFCQLYNQGTFANTNEEFDDLKVKFQEMEKEEYNMSKKVNEMMIEIGKCETSKEDDYLNKKMSGLKKRKRKKKEVDDVKKYMEEWIKECEESDEERKALKPIIDRAIMLGTQLSFMLFNLMFIMLKRKKLLKRFQEFKYSLSLLIENENFMQINQVIDMMEKTQGEMREEVKKESSEGSEELDLNQQKKDSFDKFLVQILKELQRVDYVLMYPGLLVLKMLRKLDLKLYEEGLKQYGEYLKGIQMKINKLNESFSFIFGSEEVKKFESRSRPVHGQITEWWNKYGDMLKNGRETTDGFEADMQRQRRYRDET